MKKILFLTIIFFLPCVLYSQQTNKFAEKYFRTISVNQGLSQSTIFKIVQDSLGFIWMGTQNGLNRFDGEHFKIYLPVNGDKNSLQSNYIRSLLVDKKGMLWIGGNRGISCYDHHKETFKNYALPVKTGEWVVMSIVYDEAGKIWAATSYGDIYYYDVKSDQFIPYMLNGSGQHSYQILQIVFHHNLLYVGTDDGLQVIDVKTKKLLYYTMSTVRSRVNSMLLDGDSIWIGTEGEGLFNYNTTDQSITNYKHAKMAPYTLVDNDVRSLEKDAKNNLWIGTFKGLSILDFKDHTFTNYYHQATNPYTISQNSVRYIYRDRQNGMWLGTFFGGVSYYHPDDIKFNLMDQYTGPLALNDQVVNVIAEDPYRNIWIGTNDKGLNFWNTKTGKITYYSYKDEDNNSITSDNIKAIAFDERGNAIIGTHNMGLNYINRQSGKITCFFHDSENPSSISGNMPHALLRDHKNRIWVGTLSGLDQFHPQTGKFTHYYFDKFGQRLSSDQITFLKEDSKGRIWVGTLNGVNIFYPDDNKFEVFKGDLFTNNLVYSITEDTAGRIWTGTREGLNLFDENKRVFIAYHDKSDSSRDIIYSLQADNDGNLWFSTDKGLVRLNFANKKTELFDNRNGLGKDQFSLSASCKTNDGMLLFGGLNGLCYFYPKSVIQKPLRLNVVFTGLDLLNLPVVPHDQTHILEDHINTQHKLKFQYDYKQFTVFFNAFNYISPGKISYYYKLDGFDNDWQKCEGSPKVTYANLKAGDYVFHVKAISPTGETSRERTLSITILSPWWRSTWFYALIIALIFGGIYMAYRITVARLKTLHQLRLERSEREKTEYINQVKMEFFTNVSHEFRTPLTLIIAPLEEMLNDTVPEKTSHRHHKLMLINAKRLFHLVDQLLEFRKTELGTRKLRLEKGEIVSFVHELYTSFNELAKRNNIRYYFRASESRIVAYFDKDALEKITFNLLSNAFKHTRPNDTIEITLSTIDDHIILKFIDSGNGIALADQPYIFERFYQASSKSVNVGSGVGLAFTKSLVELHHGKIDVQSEPGQGTVFTVMLPLDLIMYAQEDYSNNDIYEVNLGNDNSYAAFADYPDNGDDHEFVEKADIFTDKECLLIVDDNYEIIDYLTSYFNKTYKIYTAANGLEALSVVEETPIDLVICDVMMPDLDGIGFCKKIKKNITTCHIPIILLTAKNETSDQIKGFEVGADDYMTKPFSISLLETKIQNILRSRKRLKEHYSTSREIVPENITLNNLDEEFLTRAILIIEQNLTDSEFSVLKFSQEIGMSRSNLYLKLKAITGESSIDFIKRIRFKKAAELLESKKYNMSEVAYMSGFNSPSYFSTSFKQYYGCLPTEFVDAKT